MLDFCLGAPLQTQSFVASTLFSILCVLCTIYEVYVLATNLACFDPLADTADGSLLEHKQYDEATKKKSCVWKTSNRCAFGAVMRVQYALRSEEHRTHTLRVHQQENILVL